MSRWLYNVYRIRFKILTNVPIQWWGRQAQTPQNNLTNGTAPETSRNANEETAGAQTDTDDSIAVQEQGNARVSDANDRPLPVGQFPFRFGKFTGQGRVMQFNGLSWAVLEELKGRECQELGLVSDYDTLAAAVAGRLAGPRPPSWYVTALISLVIVAAEIMLAFMLAFDTPTIGLGCWSGSFGLYAMLSSASWVVAFFSRKPRYHWTLLCHLFNFLSLSWLIIVTMFIVSPQSGLRVKSDYSNNPATSSPAP